MRLPSVFRGLPRTFWVLWLGNLIDRIGGFGYTFLGLYLTGPKHLPIDEAAAILSLAGLGGLGGSLVGGILADHLGRKMTLVMAMTSSGLAMAALGLVREPWPIAVLWLIYGFGGAAGRPAASALVADTIPAADRLRAFGLLHWSVNIGFAIAPIIGGVLARRTFTGLFLADGATTLLTAALIAVQVPNTPLPPQTDPMWRGLTRVFRDPPYLGYLAFVFVTAVIYAQAECTLPIDIVAHGLDPATYGLVIAVNGVLITLLSPVASAWLRSSDPVRVLAAAMALTAVGFGLNALVTTAPLYAVAIAVWTVGEIASSPANGALVASLAPTEQRGRYSGAYSMSYSLARFAGPWLGGLVLGRLGSRTLWLGCLAVGLLGAAGFWAMAPSLRRRMAELRSSAS